MAVEYPHLEATAQGHMIKGTKVPARRLWYWHNAGIPVATLMKRYPTLPPAKILCALAFGYDNPDIFEKELASDFELLQEREPKQLELSCQRRSGK